MTSHPETIAERYVVKEVIGTGGMGQVLRAHDPHLAIDVAIKLLHKNDIDTTAARLQREAVAAGKLNHKNIARVFNFGQTSDGEPYMVMEFVQGITLADLIKKESHLSVEQSIEIFIQICSGLQLAHSNKIVHRDLKPSNIMLAENHSKGEREAKILDFGVAKLDHASQKLTSTSAVIGSPLYMSPEQASALDIDSRSDIYSLGCLMFETLTGIVPLKGKNALETISLHKGKAPPLISDVIEHADFPQKLVELVNRCLAKLPEQRPQSVSEISTELRSIQEELAHKAIYKKASAPRAAYIPKTTMKQLAIVLVGVSILGITVFAPVKFLFDRKNRAQERLDKKLDKSQKVEDWTKEAQRADIKKTVESKPTRFYSIAGGGRGIVFNKFIIDYELNKVQEFPDLRGVTIRDCMLLKGSGLKYLSSSNIDQVLMDRTKIKDEYLKYLIPMKNLNLLTLSSPNLSDKGVESLAQNKNLQYISLASEALTDRTAELLSSIPDLKNVELTSKKLTDKSVDFLLTKKIWSLGLIGTSLGPDIGVKIAKMPLCKEVNLSDTGKLSIASLKALANSPVLNLNLAGVPLSKEHFQALSKSKHLAELRFLAYPGCSKDIEGLLAIDHPLSLNISSSHHIDDELIESITRLPLVKLDLQRSNLTDKQLIKLAKMKTLKIVRVQDCPNISVFGEEGFHKFFKLMWKRDCNLEVRMNPSLEGFTEQLNPIEDYRINELSRPTK